MMEELKFDITIEQGAEFPLDLIYADDNENPVDVSGWIVESVIRESAGEERAIPFMCAADSSGFHLLMSSARTMQLTFDRGEYDVFITDPDHKTRTKLVSGRVTVVQNTVRNVR